MNKAWINSSLIQLFSFKLNRSRKLVLPEACQTDILWPSQPLFLPKCHVRSFAYGANWHHCILFWSRVFRGFIWSSSKYDKYLMVANALQAHGFIRIDTFSGEVGKIHIFWQSVFYIHKWLILLLFFFPFLSGMLVYNYIYYIVGPCSFRKPTRTWIQKGDKYLLAKHVRDCIFL